MRISCAARFLGLREPVLDGTLLTKLPNYGVDGHSWNDGGCVEADYVLTSGGRLGSGVFGVVRVAERRESGERRACKTLSTTLHFAGTGHLVRPDLAALRGEISALSLLRGHPRILLLHAVYEARLSIHLITELCMGGDLASVLAARSPLGLDDSLLRMIAWQLFDAIAYMHGSPIFLAHRDIQPGNIMFAEANGLHTLKLIDFGTCLSFAKNTHEDACLWSRPDGTPTYHSPEKLAGLHGAKADVWAAGITAYQAAVGIPVKGPPISPATLKLMRQDALHKVLEQPQAANLTSDCCAMLKAVLAVDIKQRPTARRALDSLHYLKSGASEHAAATRNSFETNGCWGSSSAERAVAHNGASGSTADEHIKPQIASHGRWESAKPQSLSSAFVAGEDVQLQFGDGANEVGHGNAMVEAEPCPAPRLL